MSGPSLLLSIVLGGLAGLAIALLLQEVRRECENERLADLELLLGLRCRGCGCTEVEACEGGCWWVARGLCSNCAGPPRATRLYDWELDEVEWLFSRPPALLSPDDAVLLAEVLRPGRRA